MTNLSDHIKSSDLGGNFAFHDEAISFENSNQKKFVLLIDDLERCLIQIFLKGKEINDLLEDDWNYEERKFRSAFGKALNHLNSNSVSANLGSQTLNTIKALDLYASYRLGSKPTSFEKGPENLTKAKLEKLYAGKNLRVDFEEWLRSIGKEKSVRHYSGALSGTSSSKAGCDIFSIKCPKAFEIIKEEVQADQEFSDLNERGKGMYSAALSHYTDFLRHLCEDTLADSFRSICDFCREYESRSGPIKTSDLESHNVLQNLKTLLLELEKDFSKYRGVDFTFAHSKGSGSFPRVPWVGILPPGQNPKSGIYFSMCFGREGNGAVAGLAESVQNRGRLKVKDRTEESKVINANGGDPKQHYNNTFENPLEILRESFLYDELKSHICASLDKALAYMEIKQGHPPMPFTEIPEKLSDCTICKSILTKPFSILTGASGTGKTKLATSLAEYLCNGDKSNSAVVAVGADWTDNRNVLGFVNHLKPAPDGQPYYQSTPILDLLLRASNDGNVPYFLILDEMNLSHVERYFSDFLSVMELQDGSFKLHSENDRLTRPGQSEADVPPALEYPDNLFVIGTVNIDETTYMFSPKVLDRANVIEFTVSDTEIESFLKNPRPYENPETAAPGVAEGFLALAKQARSMNCEALPAKTHEEIASHLLNLFRILKAGRFEFAYRSAKEITIYLQVSRHLANDKDAWDSGGWQGDLDDQILQKLLPKLHGSVGRVGSLLATLGEYCQSGTYNEGTKPSLNAALDLQGDESAAFPGSLAKLKVMIRTLQDEQFVSFIQ